MWQLPFIDQGLECSYVVAPSNSTCVWGCDVASITAGYSEEHGSVSVLQGQLPAACLAAKWPPNCALFSLRHATRASYSI